MEKIPAYFNNPALLTKLRNLIANSKTSEALLLLFEAGYEEAILLKVQLDTANAQYEDREISFEAWCMVLNRINYAIFHGLKENSNDQEISVIPRTDALKESRRSQPFGPVPHIRVRDLIEKNKTAEALELCRNLGAEYTLLKVRFNNLKRNVGLGLVPNSAAAEIESQINEAILILILEAPDGELEHEPVVHKGTLKETINPEVQDKTLKIEIPIQPENDTISKANLKQGLWPKIRKLLD